MKGLQITCFSKNFPVPSKEIFSQKAAHIKQYGLFSHFLEVVLPIVFPACQKHRKRKQ